MSSRKNIFAIHSWDHSNDFVRLKKLLFAKESGLADYSVPQTRPLLGSDTEVCVAIQHRIRMASAVLVVNTPKLHRRRWSSFEMKQAVAMNKRIIVVQPHGEPNSPIPKALDGAFYKVTPWRSDVVGKAIQGHYQQDERVFDIAEIVERRLPIQITSGAATMVSFILLVREFRKWVELRQELDNQSICMPGSTATAITITVSTFLGAVLAGLLALSASRDPFTAFLAALAGGLTGAVIGSKLAHADVLRRISDLQTLNLAR